MIRSYAFENAKGPFGAICMPIIYDVLRGVKSTELNAVGGLKCHSFVFILFSAGLGCEIRACKKDGDEHMY